MTLPRARVLRGDEATPGTPLMAAGPAPSQRRRIAREELEARLAADRIVLEAREQAEAIVARARTEASAAAVTAQRDAGADADARLAARWLALRQAEVRRAGDDADRVLTIAVALAERLVGAALEVDPTRITSLASGVLAEARGARRAVLHAHPLDAELLRTQLSVAGLDAGSVVIEGDATLARGALRLHTDVGIIDAELHSRLDRLAESLRDALR